MKRNRIIEICQEAAKNSLEKYDYLPGWVIEAATTAVEESVRRDHFAACAPINFDIVGKIFGGEASVAVDGDRAAFMAVWAMVSFEYADAMMEARK